MPRSRAGSVAHYLRMACGLVLLMAAMSTIWLGLLAGLWALVDA